MTRVPAPFVLVALLSAGAGCGDSRSQSDKSAGSLVEVRAEAATAAAGDRRETRRLDCRERSFSRSLALPEASAAAYVRGRSGAADTVLVVGDSGNRGAYVHVDASTGEVVESGKLPLKLTEATDDLEGLALVGEALYALSSNGWMRKLRRAQAGSGYELIDGPYPIGDVENGAVCSKPGRSNCGRNYEGLCLLPPGVEAVDGCDGYAASLKRGSLYCLQFEEGGRLRLRSREPIPIARAHTLSGCAVAADGTVWVGTNALGGNAIGRLEFSPAPTVVWSGVLAPPMAEAITIAPNGEIFRFADIGYRRPSLAKKYACGEP